MSTKAPLVLGTANRKKGRELAELYQPLGLEILTLADFPEAISVEETGATFADNARLKATLQARHLARWVLADDSGLMVDVLGGAPGVFSARYAGPQSTDESNNRRLLHELSQVPIEERTARFVCHMTLADPSGAVRAESEESCRGRILFESRGTLGFGYDPLFEVAEYHQSFGQLSPVVKSCLSHRSRAARMLIPALQDLVKTGQWT